MFRGSLIVLRDAFFAEWGAYVSHVIAKRGKGMVRMLNANQLFWERMCSESIQSWQRFVRNKRRALGMFKNQSTFKSLQGKLGLGCHF